MGNWSKGIGQVKEDDMDVSFVFLRRLDLVPDYAGMLQATREPRNASLLYGWINVLVLFQVGGQPVCYHAEKHFSLNVEKADWPELTYVCRILFLGN